MSQSEDLYFDPEQEAEVGRGSDEALLKSLSVGFGTDAAGFVGGRIFQPEDCEGTLINVLREDANEFKMMNTIKKTPVGATVHQWNIREDVGDAEVGFVTEGEDAPENNQTIRRMTKNMAYIQKHGQVTEQALLTSKLADAMAEEKIAVTLSILRTAEKNCFHGDSKVVPEQFDGIPAQIRETPAAKRVVFDAGGKRVGAIGEKILSEIPTLAKDNGGLINKVFYPNILAQDIQALAHDRLRFNNDTHALSIVIDEYPTIWGNMQIAKDAGPDMMYLPKTIVKPGQHSKIPNKPSAVAAIAAAHSRSRFNGDHTGIYNYTVHSINKYGISEGTNLSIPVSVASGEAVTLNITPAASNPGTGLVICRSAPNGDIVMEMIRIPINAAETTTEFVDLNVDLPGTAEMLFITERKIQPIVEFFQLLPMRFFERFPVNALVRPFVMALWGTPSVKAPHYCGLATNIAYQGGLYG
jgi:hypothetical protein